MFLYVEGPNLLQYVSSSPVNRIDPNGTDSWYHICMWGGWGKGNLTKPCHDVCKTKEDCESCMKAADGFCRAWSTGKWDVVMGKDPSPCATEIEALKKAQQDYKEGKIKWEDVKKAGDAVQACFEKYKNPPNSKWPDNTKEDDKKFAADLKDCCKLPAAMAPSPAPSSPK